MTTHLNPDAIRDSIRYAQDTLNLLLQNSAPELAKILVTEERPTESELPETGKARWVRAIEVVTRALEYLEWGADELDAFEKAWRVQQGAAGGAQNQADSGDCASSTYPAPSFPHVRKGGAV